VRAGRRRRPSTERLKGVAPPQRRVAPDQDDPLAEAPQETRLKARP
jgi:hypothetical protein